MEKTLTITPSRCIACRTCELACAFQHAANGRPGISRIRAFMFGEGRNQIVTCFQCDEAACVKVCQVEALARVGVLPSNVKSTRALGAGALISSRTSRS